MDCVFLSGRSSTSMPLSFKLLISVSATTSSPINKEKKNRKKRKESKVEQMRVSNEVMKQVTQDKRKKGNEVQKRKKDERKIGLLVDM